MIHKHSNFSWRNLCRAPLFLCIIVTQVALSWFSHFKKCIIIANVKPNRIIIINSSFHTVARICLWSIRFLSVITQVMKIKKRDMQYYFLCNYRSIFKNIMRLWKLFFEELWRKRRKIVSRWNKKNESKRLYDRIGAVLKLDIWALDVQLHLMNL